MRIRQEVSIDLTRLPRFPLASLPTPLQDAARLRTALGGSSHCPRILIKRDDLTGLAFGGNKVRKLEFLVGDALEKGATTLITAGAAQSNHARATAAAAVVAGMSSVLVLNSKDPDPPIQGNLLLDRMLGADVRIVPTGTDRAAVMEEIAAELTARGEKPYVIPVGGSNAIGAAGYLTMMLELQVQLAALGTIPSRICFGSGSGGTQAGIVLGAKALGLTCELVGILDSPFSDEEKARTLAIANQAAQLVGSETRVTEADMVYDDRYIGEAYGVPTYAGEEAIRLLARTQAIFLDSVYTGKAMSGLIDHIRSGKIDPADTVVFIHTGGTPAIFAAADRLARAAMAG
jgi:D-cysteine desulfhydrase family pyridoxal phosphate-dependent enzyme